MNTLDDDSRMVGGRLFPTEAEAIKAAEMRVMSYMENQHRIKMVKARRAIDPDACLQKIMSAMEEARTCKEDELKRLKFQVDTNIALLKLCKI